MAAETDVTTIDEDDVPEDTAVERDPADTLDEAKVEEVSGNGAGANGSGTAEASTVVDEPELDEDLDDVEPEADDAEATTVVDEPEQDEDLEADEDAEALEVPAEDEVEEEVAPAEVPPVAPKRTRRQHRAEMKASARRIRRVVRHIDTWSVFKVATLFIACVWGIVVLASLLIWRAAVSSGSVENTEDFIVDLGFEDFQFEPQQMFEALLSAGAVAAIAAIFFVWLLTVLFNLICDITGGIRVTMIEQDLADARKRRNRRSATPDGAEADSTD